MLAGGRGGYCFEVNTVLRTLLTSLGFEVERRQGIVGPRDAFTSGSPTNHMALVATTPEGERFIVEAGRGDGFLDPLPLAEGTWQPGGFPWSVERDGDGWWVVAEHGFTSTPGFRFADEPATLDDFAPHHHRLSTAPDSSFIGTLVVQQPQEGSIVTLRARTLSALGPGIDETRGAPRAGCAWPQRCGSASASTPTRWEPKRMARLWRNASAQHDAFTAERAAEASS